MPKKPRPDRLEQILGDMLELPKDLVLDLPRLVVIGQRNCTWKTTKG